ncbi:MAG: PQQ-binding-like beta-propeller repeat protein [Planctomycetota bacterium]
MNKLPHAPSARFRRQLSRVDFCSTVAVAFLLGTNVSFGADESLSNWPAFGGPTASFSIESDVAPAAPFVTATATIGEGRSGVVTNGTLCFVTALAESGDAPLTEAVIALDQRTLQKVWEQKYETPVLDAQESFGGKQRSPQSTPLLMKNSDGDELLVTIGFAGRLHVFRSKTGKLLWKKNLVEAFDATPVQFGFSSSPIEVDGQLIVLAGGKTAEESQQRATKGGLVALSPGDGTVLWQVPTGEASYATPVVAEWGNQKQIVFCTRNRVISVTTSGNVLWEREFPELGLTNVPTPLVTGDGLIISGQGMQGTEKWSVSKQDVGWSVRQEWRSDEQFFYCNWGVSNDRVFGCTGNLLVAINADTGETLGKWRGFSEANLSVHNQMIYVLGGKGTLSKLAVEPAGISVEQSWSIDGRFWTPMSWSKGQSYIREGSELKLISWGSSSGTPLPSIDRSSTRKLAWTRKPGETVAPALTDRAFVNPLERIVSAFEKNGIDAAFRTYESIRKTAPKSLTLAMRKQLSAQAEQIGQSDLASSMAIHAYRDLQSDAAKQWVLEQTPVVPDGQESSSVGKNGLRYLKLALVTFGPKLDAEIRGPAKHPFGYGFPLRTAEVRRENWPIGSRVTDSNTGRLLKVITAEDEGQVLVISK